MLRSMVLWLEVVCAGAQSTGRSGGTGFLDKQIIYGGGLITSGGFRNRIIPFVFMICNRKKATLANLS